MTTSGDVLLVTGGSGLVGEALKLEILSNIEVWNKFKNIVFLSSKDADLTDFEQTGDIFKKYKPNYVINLAAKVGGLYSNMLGNELFYNENMKINENVLYWANEMKVEKCISCLSTCIFPDKIDYPLDETKIHMGPPHASNQGYSLAKRHVDKLNNEYNQKSCNSLFTAVIPTNIYGSNDNFNLEHAHVVPCLIHKAYITVTSAIANGLKEATIKVSGSGKPLRQFLYSRDLGKILYWSIENYSDPAPMIVCPDHEEEVTIAQVAGIISDIFQEKFRISLKLEFEEEKSDGQYKKTASNSKFRSLYQGFQFTPLKQGLEEVITWFIGEYPNVRK